MDFSDAQVADYRRDGFIVARGLFTDDELAAATAAVAAAASAPPDGVRRFPLTRPDDSLMVWLSDLHQRLPALRAILDDGRVGRLAAQLLNSQRVTLAQDTAFVKPPHLGGAVGWHQDGSYWQHAAPLDMVTAWVALTPSHERSGAVWVLPGSHDLGLLPATVLDAFSGDPDHFLRWHGLLDEPRTCLELSPGDVSFHHPLTVHGSYDNRSDASRMGYVVHCLGERARYRPSGARRWQRRASAVAPGARFDGPKHPVLHPR